MLFCLIKPIKGKKRGCSIINQDMLHFITFFATNFFQDFWKNFIFKLSFLGQYINAQSIFSVYCPFKVIRHCWKCKFVSAFSYSLCVFWNTPKEFYRSQRIRQKYFWPARRILNKGTVARDGFVLFPYISISNIIHIH